MCVWGGVFPKGSGTQEKLRQPQPIPVGLSGVGVPPIFFLFTCPDLVVSQSGFSTEITHFFKASSHTIMKLNPKTHKQTDQCSRPARLRKELILEF